MSWQRFRSILRARDKEFIRDRSALAWNILFPLMIVLGFAYAFTDEEMDRYKVGLVDGGVGVEASVNGVASLSDMEFLSSRYVQFIKIPADQLEASVHKVQRHQLDLLLDTQAQRYWLNETSPAGYMLEKLLLAGGGGNYHKQSVTDQQVRYVDWLIPGVMGMNMMFSALFGVGYVVVRYRKNGVLKRLHATPLSALEFLAAQIVSRLWLIMAITVVVYVGCDWLIGFAMYGSYINLFLVFSLGAVAMISMGLVVAARVKSEEMAGGLLNMMSWPMMFLSGVWFSLEGLHPLVQKLALIFPLTHITEAARVIMIDGAGLAAIWPNLLALMVMSIVFLILGVLLFRWE